LFLALLALCICLSALLSSWYVTRQLSAAMEARSTGGPRQDADVGVPTLEVDFYDATGITREELQQFLRDSAQREQVDTYPALVTLQNSRGDYLAESHVIVRWDNGEQRLLVGRSGVFQFLLQEQQLPGLKIIAPAGYSTLRQRSIPLGTAYDPEETLDVSDSPFHVHYDGYIHTAVTRGLSRLRSGGQSIPADAFQEQLRRRGCTLDLAPPHAKELTADGIYRLNRDTVVVIAHLYPDGRTTQATGFVLDDSGVIATNYHVVDKPTAVVRGVLTSANRMHAVTQVLAADKAGDVALIKIAATDLKAVRLADAAPEGAEVTIISHPNSHYYSLTQGSISRYWAATSYGRVRLRMAVTAEFAAGSSGAPLFDTRGNVIGIASNTRNEGYQMVRRTAIPVQTIKKLIGASVNDRSGVVDAD
jgi:hypothetical protein